MYSLHPTCKAQRTVRNQMADLRSSTTQSHQNPQRFLTKLNPIRRTVRTQTADRPQVNSLKHRMNRCLQHRYIRWLSEDPTADRPLPLSGLSAIQPRKPTRDNIVSGQISSSTADCPLSNSGSSTVLFYGTTRDNIVFGQILTWPADCPAPLGGPSATPIFDTAHQAAASVATAAAVAHRCRRHITEGNRG